VENRKLAQKVKTGTLRSTVEIRGVSPEDEKGGYDGKDLQKRVVLS